MGKGRRGRAERMGWENGTNFFESSREIEGKDSGDGWDVKGEGTEMGLMKARRERRGEWIAGASLRCRRSSRT